MPSSRTARSIKNSIVSMLFFLVELIISFYSRKIFLDYLGTELLGLNTTIVNILQFLNLAELGITSAVGFSLYTPLRNQEYEKINEIVSFQGQLYKRIALVIILGSIVIIAFFPIIFEKISISLWYAYLTFIVVLYSSLLTYFCNYKMIVLSSAQMDYKITSVTRSCKIVGIIFQILAVKTLPYPYTGWLGIQFVYSSISAFLLNKTIRKKFPTLKDSGKKFLYLKGKYNIILIKVKQLFFHKLAAFALTQTSPLIIYTYLSLSMVAIYGNYTLITTGIFALCNAVFNSIGAGVGDLIAEGNKTKIFNVFEELLCIRILLSVFFVFEFVLLTQPFIQLWVGSEFLLSKTTLCLLAASLYLIISRNTVDLYINGYGLFSDIWAPVIETVLNLGLSILLGYFWSLNGILLGILISQIIIIFCWKPYFLFKKGLQLSFMKYIRLYSKYLLLSLISIAIIEVIYNYFNISYHYGWFGLIRYATITMMVSLVVFVGIFSVAPSFRITLTRFKRIIK